jgi:hypothetical protein
MLLHSLQEKMATDYTDKKDNRTAKGMIIKRNKPCNQWLDFLLLNSNKLN